MGYYNIMTYHRGTLSEFNIWHEAVKIKEGLPKIGYVNGQPAPHNQGTTGYSQALQNPNKSDDYVWIFGAYPIKGKQDLSQADVDGLKWFPGDI